jgi:hypothetical protein
MTFTIKILINHQDITVSGKSKAVEHLPHHPKMLGSSLVRERRRKEIKLSRSTTRDFMRKC